MKRLKWALALFVCLLAARDSRGSGGVLLPWSGAEAPDEKLLALRRMDVRVTINDLHAEVRVTQVWENKTGSPVEGQYVFPLGERARLSDFALWEGDRRMQGIVLEKMRARRIYEEITTQQLDPG